MTSIIIVFLNLNSANDKLNNSYNRENNEVIRGNTTISSSLSNSSERGYNNTSPTIGVNLRL